MDEIFPDHVEHVVGAMERLSAAEQQTLARLCRKLGLGEREAE